MLRILVFEQRIVVLKQEIVAPKHGIAIPKHEILVLKHEFGDFLHNPHVLLLATGRASRNFPDSCSPTAIPSRSVSLLVSEGFDGVQFRGGLRRVEAKDDADRAGD